MYLTQLLSNITVYDQYIFAGWQQLYVLKCAQVLASLLEEDVPADEGLDPLIEDCRCKVASLQERLLHRTTQNDEQMTESDKLQVRSGALLPFGDEVLMH